MGHGYSSGESSSGRLSAGPWLVVAMASEVETTPSAHHANRLTAESKSAYLPVADRDSSDSEGAYGHRMVVKMTWMVR